MAPFKSYPVEARQALQDAHRNPVKVVQEETDSTAIAKGRQAVQESLELKASKTRDNHAVQ